MGYYDISGTVYSSDGSSTSVNFKASDNSEAEKVLSSYGSSWGYSSTYSDGSSETSGQVKRRGTSKKRKRSKSKPVPKWIGGKYVEDRTVENITKYEYTYGINDISIGSAEYSKASVLVTTPIVENKNVREITIEATEIHPSFNLSGGALSRITSVEYYISYGDGFVPILPSNQSTVLNEYVFFTNGVGTLRFKADMSKPSAMYKDGVIMSAGTDWFLINNGTQVTVTNYNSADNYTIDYTPDMFKNPDRIIIPKDIIERKLATVTESFAGTDANMKIALSNTPYTDMGSILDPSFNPNSIPHYPVSVHMTNANIIDSKKKKYETITQPTGDPNQSVYISNVTDYRSRAIPPMKAFDPVTYPIIEYAHVGKDIYFTESFKNSEIYENITYGSHGNANIHVTYQYPHITVTGKIILRRTTDNYDKGTSPAVTSFIVHSKIVG